MWFVEFMMRGSSRRILALLVWLAFGVGPGQVLAEPEHKVALVIGNSKYPGESALINPVNDADDMCAALKRLGFETLCHKDLKTRKEFFDRLEELAGRLKPNSKGLLYYAGHGVQVGGENYLVPVQADAQSVADVPKVLVGLQQILRRLKKTSNEFNIVILDACRDNPYGSSTPAGARGLRVIGSRAPNAGLPAPSAATEVIYGLGSIRDAPAGSIVLYATASDDRASDGGGRNGSLTKHLLAHLETPGINVEEMIKRVTLGVQNDTRQRQIPFTYGSFTGEFCFAGCGPKIDPAEVERLRQERADFEKRLKDRSAVDQQRKSEPRVFVPPTL
jgi:uncharacterized caspase-like protein